MPIHRYALVLILLAAIMACNMPTTGTVSPQQAASTSTEIAATLTPELPPTSTDTPSPSDTPTITPTATPSTPMVTPAKEDVNCRFGPGVNYLSTGALLLGNAVPILGKNEDGTWWQIQNPNANTQKCWVSASYTTASGDLGAVPIAQPPLAFVTGLTISVTPKSISVAGCMGPIQPIVLKGTITVNGPATVKWHFATQQGGSLSSHSTTFTAFGSQDVSDGSYTPPLTEGKYWARLVIDSPNSITADATYKIECP